ncbi:MAG: hypothetical protein RL610_917, partial [Pseudomonadota bacterium]
MNKVSQVVVALGLVCFGAASFSFADASKLPRVK